MENILINIRELLSTGCELPVRFGALHITSLVAMAIALAILVPVFCRADDKTVRRICTVFWLILITIETFKQFNAATSVYEGKLIFDYSLGALPLHICSSPFYIFPVFIFAKNESTRQTAAVFMFTFSFIGGLAVMTYPDTVFGEQLYINLQSMIHHSIQVTAGICLGFRYGRKLNFKNFFNAVGIFLFMGAIALFVNLITHEYFVSSGITSELNLFFISPYMRFVPPALEGFGIDTMPYPLYLTIFFSLFALVALIIALIFSAFSLIFARKGTEEIF